MVPQVHDLPPRGHYLASEVGRLAGVSGQTIGNWERYGYIQASQRAKGVVTRRGRGTPSSYPLVYSFQDVAEAMVVHELILAKASLKAIGQTIDNLREEYGDWPLSKAPLLAGYGLVAIRQGEALIDVTTHPDQAIVIREEDLTRVASALVRGGWAVREMPDLRYIEVNPDRLSGRPAIRGHRVGAEQVARLAAQVDGRAILHEDYDLNDAEINDAERWWARVQEYEPAA